MMASAGPHEVAGLSRRGGARPPRGPWWDTLGTSSSLPPSPLLQAAPEDTGPRAGACRSGHRLSASPRRLGWGWGTYTSALRTLRPVHAGTEKAGRRQRAASASHVAAREGEGRTQAARLPATALRVPTRSAPFRPRPCPLLPAPCRLPAHQADTSQLESQGDPAFNPPPRSHAPSLKADFRPPLKAASLAPLRPPLNSP
jgi:hypothetical protein